MVESVSPSEAKSLLSQGKDKGSVVYLDVRMPDEFVIGHVPGAINIPVTLGGMALEPSFVNQVKEKIPDDAHVIVGCKSGRRSSMAIGELMKNGFDASRLSELQGGFDAWSSTSDLPVEK